MKKIIYSLLFVITAVCAACDEELPKASFDLYELKTLTATAGDMNVALSWEAYPDARPDEYLISWTSGSSGAEGGHSPYNLAIPEDWRVSDLLLVRQRMQDIR